MKIHPRYYPAILITTFILFVLLGLVLGFRPQHSGGGSPRSVLDWLSYALLALGALA